MTDIEVLPPWGPIADLNVADLANALEHIRRAAWAHWIGDAFDPAHMHAIAAVAAMALLGDPIAAPVDTSSPEWRAMIAERHQEWIDVCDDGIMAAAGLVAETGEECERCGGVPCSECGECPDQVCRDCRCELRYQGDDEREDEGDD